ncbi:hypothetical protein [Schleiferilactobacillus shenzhenensis]|uniref:HK97 gp10 family phage protein n=1 Tax=Schleiferilactobacillus shenzhenensis LY-73 TaxID=1231336 RepID=U4TQG7_9LACO|nr:hypothetical protein [Schleiferilactobacillus shenzhenensis]ERL63762.1 hypothetical protein L248_2179 [Schleiferilactobacillus shenzhenensis LY-73]
MWDNDHIPTVEFGLNPSYSAAITSMSNAFRSVGSKAGVQLMQRTQYAMDTHAKAFIEKLGTDTQQKAREIERDQVGHSKSGYIPTGNLMRNINHHESDDGLTTQTYPEAQSKDGYNYGQAVEFGLKDRNYPADPFMKPAGEEVSKNLNGRSRQALNEAMKEARQ